MNILSAFQEFETIQNNDGMSKCEFTCVNCGRVLHNRDEQCYACGQKNNDEIDFSPEWRCYDGEAQKSRCNVHISESNPFQSKVRHTSKILYTLYARIYEVCENNGIDKCIANDIKECYTMLNNKRCSGNNPMIIRGTNILGLVCMCILYVCRKNNIYYITQEVADMMNIDHKDVTRSSKIFTRIMNDNDVDIDKRLDSTIVPEHFIERYCKIIKIVNKDHINQAIVVARNIEKISFITKHEPNSIALACILFIIKLNNINLPFENLLLETRSVQHVARMTIFQKSKCILLIIFNKTETTILSVCRHISNNRRLLLNEDITSFYLHKICAQDKSALIMCKYYNMNISIINDIFSPMKKHIRDLRVISCLLKAKMLNTKHTSPCVGKKNQHRT